VGAECTDVAWRVDASDKKYLVALLRTLGAVDGWAARMDPDATPGRPSPASILAADDAVAHSYQLSHAALLRCGR
jgi:hypothetical protein